MASNELDDNHVQQMLDDFQYEFEHGCKGTETDEQGDFLNDMMGKTSLKSEEKERIYELWVKLDPNA